MRKSPPRNPLPVHLVPPRFVLLFPISVFEFFSDHNPVLQKAAIVEDDDEDEEEKPKKKRAPPKKAAAAEKKEKAPPKKRVSKKKVRFTISRSHFLLYVFLTYDLLLPGGGCG